MLPVFEVKKEMSARITYQGFACDQT
jgi:hypothetical protein